MAGHDYRVAQIRGFRVAQLVSTAPDAARISAVVGPLFTRLAKGLAEAGVLLGEESVATYSTDEQGRIRLTAGFPVEVLPSTGDEALQDVEVVELPGYDKAVTASYTGPVSGIGAAWAGLFQWMTDRGYRSCAPCREIYHLSSQADPDGWQIELQQPVH